MEARSPKSAISWEDPRTNQMWQGNLPQRAFAPFGLAAAHVLSPDFHDHLLRAAASLVPYDLLSIIRYSRFSAPDFFGCQDYTPDFVALYNREYYRHDPY